MLVHIKLCYKFAPAFMDDTFGEAQFTGLWCNR